MTTTRVAIGLWAAAFVVLAAVWLGMSHRGGTSAYSPWRAAVEPIVVELIPRSDTLSILWVGDTMLGDAVQEYIDEHGYLWPLEDLRTLLRSDFVIANAEAPITTRTGHWNPDQPWTYNANPESAWALAQSGVHALGLANNHMLDRGPDGLLETLAHAREAGLLTFGAGETIDEAEAPLVLRSPFGTIGVVAIGEDPGRRRTAAPDTVGIVGLSRVWVHRGIEMARRAGADHVVAYVHWGQNYHHVNERQRSWARVFAEAGYDLVIGHHPHVVQPIEIIDGMPVLYSLGNFVFGTRGRFSEQFPGYGLAVTTEFTREGATALKLRCIVTDNRRVDFQPRPCDPPEADSVLTSLHRDVVMHGDVGVLPWTRRSAAVTATASAR